MGSDFSQEGEQPVEAGKSPNHGGGERRGADGRREKRKAMKKQKRKKMRKEAAIKEREEEEELANDPEEQMRARLREEEEAAVAERARKEFEERERLWIEEAEARRRKAMEEKEKEVEEAEKNKLLEEGSRQQRREDLEDNDGEWAYVEEGPAEIIWKENEIIVKKKRVKIPKRSVTLQLNNQEDDRPTSNPLPPSSAAFASFKSEPPLSAQELMESVAQQTPNFGTEQDKTHCPFHLKTGVCRFGTRCNRTHFYPDKSCTLLIKSMYAGPGFVWEQDEGLEYTDEEIERSFEEFYEDVHTEFLKFGEIFNFKVCRNGSFHLRGNVYVHYKNLESAVLAHSAINGRYFAGKQIACEFVGVTKWKVAICGEYMKSRLKTCSRGTACNFIHCFRNPGGEYEWADWDNPPPKYWVKKMTLLFGTSDKFESSNILDVDGRHYRGRKTRTSGRSYPGSRHSKRDFHDFVSEKDALDKYRGHQTSPTRRNHSGRRRSRSNSTNEWETYEEKDCSNLHHHSPREHEHGEKRSRVFGNSEEIKEENRRKSESHGKHRRHGLNRYGRWDCFSEEHDEAGSVSGNHEYYDTGWGFDRGYEDACGRGNITYSADDTSSSRTSDNSSGCDRTQRSVDHTSGGGHSLASKVNYRDLVKDRKHQVYSSRNHSGYVSDDHICGSENKSRRHRGRDQSASSGESLSDLKDMDGNKKVPGSSFRGSWRELEESVDHSQMSSDSHHGNEKKHSGYSKRKHHRKKRTHEHGERTDGHSDSANFDSRKKKYKKGSRRLTPGRHTNSSKKKDRHSDLDL